MASNIYGEPGTLYQRCGGVFGVSAFVDRCMDRWMADYTLNANAMVTRWHESAQRPGFKFLVVQIVCNLTGGPQRYTGRPMDEAHKHLNISEAEWGVFMGLFNEVCGEFGLPAEDQDDLNALMISMEDECVVYPGERPRRDPGPWRPGGHAAYGLCGGVYPIALFADRLVDALLADARFEVATDAKRTPAALMGPPPVAPPEEPAGEDEAQGQRGEDEEGVHERVEGDGFLVLMTDHEGFDAPVVPLVDRLHDAAAADSEGQRFG